MKSKWIIVKNPETDYPETEYDADKNIYLCITKYGKTLTCKYRYGQFEAANNWRDWIEPIAYTRVQIPKIVFDQINKDSHLTVEYTNSLT